MSEFRYPNKIVAIDFETGGLSPQYDPILQVGAVVMDREGPVGDPFYTPVKPNMEKLKISLGALSVQVGDMTTSAGVSAFGDWLQGLHAAPSSQEVANQLVEWARKVGARNIPNVAQNAAFDYGFFSSWQFQQKSAFSRGSLCPVWIDTIEMARQLYPGGPPQGYGLDALCLLLDLPKREGAHNALQDAILCGQVYFKLKERLESL
jgi:DNA polymerase III epsilon subunit-like protein